MWVKFDTTTQSTRSPRGFSGQNGYGDGGMGRYGHFKVSSAHHVLQLLQPEDAPDGKSGCADNANGWGSSAQATSETDTSMGYCGVPGYIKVGRQPAERRQQQRRR